jgi:uncharacterized protein YbjT (DUF2867 family)
MQSAAIAGASGLTGRYLLNGLLEDDAFDPVIAVLRKPLHRRHPRLREKVAEFGELESLGPVALNTAFCCLGTTILKAGSREAFRAVDHGHVLSFAQWTRRNGARHFLFVSSVAAELGSRNFYLRVKGETERDLETVGFEWLDIFQPSFLLGTRDESRRGERIGQTVVRNIKLALVGPLERYRGIAASAVATAMISRAKSPGEPGVRRHEWREIMALG